MSLLVSEKKKKPFAFVYFLFLMNVFKSKMFLKTKESSTLYWFSQAVAMMRHEDGGAITLDMFAYVIHWN